MSHPSMAKILKIKFLKKHISKKNTKEQISSHHPQIIGKSATSVTISKNTLSIRYNIADIV